MLVDFTPCLNLLTAPSLHHWVQITSKLTVDSLLNLSVGLGFFFLFVCLLDLDHFCRRVQLLALLLLLTPSTTRV